MLKHDLNNTDKYNQGCQFHLGWRFVFSIGTIYFGFKAFLHSDWGLYIYNSKY